MHPFESRLLQGLGSDREAKLYLAAVSGGADSVAMLAGLASLREKERFSIHCIHIDHGLRPPEEGALDIQTVQALCLQLNIACTLISIPQGRIAAAAQGGAGIEGAARIYRYRALHRVRRRIGADLILTAHTRDDHLETILMNVLRGSGPGGLGGIAQRRKYLLRPLLGLSRTEVIQYLSERQISYQEDSTNGDPRFFRNRLRARLIPLLDEIYPPWRKTLPVLALTQSLSARFISEETRARLSWELLEGPALGIKEEDFSRAPAILQEEAIYAGVKTLKALDASLPQKGSRPLPKRSTVRKLRQGRLSGSVFLERREGLLILGSPRLDQGGFSFLIQEPGLHKIEGRVLGPGFTKDLVLRVSPPGEGSPPGSSPGAFYSSLPLVFREHRRGDRILWGGHRRGFSDILGPKERGGFTRIITGENAAGLAVLVGIGRDLRILAAEVPPGERAGPYLVSLSFKAEGKK
ncbi:MAG: tRNA lysidine(34) synthetase TilS [Treponema sp.]|nr:tRNA lysidine(34) synthetase TilS [Treponema sp.]